MVPPPPSQKGMFRPKRQPKKISRPGTSVQQQQDGTSSGNTTSSATNNGPTVAFDMTTANEAAAASSSSATTHDSSSTQHPSSGGGGGRGRGGNSNSGGGRGGKGGRGGRAPIPQGRAFFTGGTPISAPSGRAGSTRGGGVGGGSRSVLGGAAASKKGIQNRSSSGGVGAATDMSTEEVVGELDTAIGSHAGATANAGNDKFNSSGRDSDYHMDNKESRFDVERDIPSFEPYTYDSDSSNDDPRGAAKARRHREVSDNLQPLQLPFASTQQQQQQQQQQQSMAAGPVKVASSTTHETMEQSDNNSSLFGDTRYSDDDSWFLVQLPSRLPPLQKRVSPHDAASHGTVPDPAPSSGTVDGNNDVSFMTPVTSSTSAETMNTTTTTITTTNPLRNLSDVVTQPILTSKFDNELETAAPGQIGRILVYKSGRTVLEMMSQDGIEKIYMEVNEGLSCAFHQQAVVVDVDKGNYIVLGDVDKSIVVSPDLERL
ncbi:RNA polymerase III RPC4 [Nitzschia inconspicua]|uniref:RNA polymerase III RPC4 n=1 Tax=Nitzschia inconspicua TaxID=303405 RepID=A0A9K3PNH3_9STRA|nr:RNA polymerase III RPC4 [Nitzschia inconspicua]